jgi:hypothetical protein
MESIKSLIDLMNSIFKLVQEKPKTSSGIFLGVVVALIFLLYVPEKEISFRILDGDTEGKKPVGSASVTLELNGKKEQSFPTNIDGRVTFRVKSSDVCSKVVVQHVKSIVRTVFAVEEYYG